MYFPILWIILWPPESFWDIWALTDTNKKVFVLSLDCTKRLWEFLMYYKYINFGILHNLDSKAHPEYLQLSSLFYTSAIGHFSSYAIFILIVKSSQMSWHILKPQISS